MKKISLQEAITGIEWTYVNRVDTKKWREDEN
jgi:hypothetical protein